MNYLIQLIVIVVFGLIICGINYKIKIWLLEKDFKNRMKYKADKVLKKHF